MCVGVGREGSITEVAEQEMGQNCQHPKPPHHTGVRAWHVEAYRESTLQANGHMTGTQRTTLVPDPVSLCHVLCTTSEHSVQQVHKAHSTETPGRGTGAGRARRACALLLPTAHHY
jgi:hypothetical protein